MLGQANSSMLPSFKEKINLFNFRAIVFISIFLSFVFSFFGSFFLSFFLSFYLSFFLHTLSLSFCILRFLCVSLSIYQFFSLHVFHVFLFLTTSFFGGSLISAPLSLSLSPRSPCPFLLSTHPSLQQCPFILGSACVSVFFSIRFITLECAHSTLKRRRSMKLRIQRS